MSALLACVICAGAGCEPPEEHAPPWVEVLEAYVPSSDTLSFGLSIDIFAREFEGAYLEPAAYDSVDDGRDYSDPTLGGLVPLVRVAGREHQLLSENLRLGDFASSDGAAFARISPRIVEALERVMAKLGRAVNVSSGYRHLALNSRADIRGAARSMHMAGMAADIWSNGIRPIDLAEAIFDTLGCRVGVGLGRTFVHLDMRGYLATWTSRDAALTEAEFDRFANYKCSGKDRGSPPDPEMLALLRKLDAEDETEEAESYVSVADYQDVLAAFARVQMRHGRSGAVLIDFRTDSLVIGGQSYPYVMGFVASGSREARLLGVQPLIDTARQGYFAYVLLDRDQMSEIGVMSLGDRNGSGGPRTPAS